MACSRSGGLTPFYLSPITPGLVKRVWKKKSSNYFTGEDGISYHHQKKKVPSSHNFLATLFTNILLKSHSAPAVWSKAKIRILFKGSDPKLPSNFQPIALSSTIGKIFHKILATILEWFLFSNDLIDSSIQKVFLTGVNGTLEHIFTVSAILENALQYHLPLSIIFIDVKKIHSGLCPTTTLMIF